MALRFLILLAGAFATASPIAAQTDSAAARHRAECPSCETWNAQQAPFRVFGNTYYVGTHGLGSILVTSPQGHVLIDGGLAESAPGIMSHIRALGFRIEDVKLILNTHDHYDHAGGIAALQAASGATVAASRKSAEVLERGTVGPDDPQYGIALPIAPVRSVRVIADGDTLRVGSIAMVAHLTPGHTPGGTSWTWRSCEGEVCRSMVYADSQTPVSADDFHFTHNTTYPDALADFARGMATIENLPCDILLTPHPDASGLWARLARRDAGDGNALVDTGACRAYVARARATLAQRVAAEGVKK